jgi:hypothetical protein
VTRCDAVIPSEARESRPVVTVLVAMLLHRSMAELNDAQPRSLDRTIEDTSLNLQRDSNPCFSLERAVTSAAVTRTYGAVATGGCHALSKCTARAATHHPSCSSSRQPPWESVRPH